MTAEVAAHLGERSLWCERQVYVGNHSQNSCFRSRDFRPIHLCGDVRDWREIVASRYKTGHFDIVWASPPCTVFFTREDGHGASGLGAGHLDRRRGEGDNCVPEAARVVHREPAWAAPGSDHHDGCGLSTDA